MWPYVSLGSRFPMWSLCLLSLQRIQLVFRLMEEIVHSLLPGNQVCHIFFQINESHYYQFASITSMPQCSHHHNTIGFYDMQLNNNAHRFVKYEGLKNENDSYYYKKIKIGCVILGPLLGVLATSWILTGDSQKLSFSTLTKVPFLIFWSGKPCWR